MHPLGRGRAVLVAAVLAAAAGGRQARAQQAGEQQAAPAGAPRQAVLGPYERALRLVESGYGAAGRALTDSLVAASSPASPALGEALWWRAALASDAAAAERDLRRLMAEVPASPRSLPSAVRLAQLAVLRDRPDEAVALLEPLVRARPDDPARSLAGYWLARARLERRDAAGACAAILGAAGAPVLDVEVSRHLATLRERVPGCGAVVASGTAGNGTAGGAPAVAAPSGEPAAPTTAVREVASPVASPVGGGAAARVPAPGEVAVGGAPGPRVAAAEAPAPVPTVTTRPAAGSPAPTPRPPAPTAPPPTAGPAPVAAPASPGRPLWAVQVAAYDEAAGAAAMAARLRAGGIEAYAEGQGPNADAAPFRVKVGRFASSGAAAAEMAALRRRGIAGFVTTARAAAPAPSR